MKLQTSIFLLIAVLAAVVSPMNSPPMVVGLCKHTPIIGNLNPQQFFNKKWYVWKSHGGFLFDSIGSCAGMDTKIKGDEVEILQFQYESLFGKYVTARGDANAAYIKKEGLVFPVDYNISGLNFTLGFNILGTDYDNWAAVYLCHQLLGLKIELSWLLVRDRDAILGTEQLAAISESISNVEMKLEDFELKYNDNCGPDEPHL